MCIHKLTAGTGYDYLTRQVAALDATEKGHTGLASYYTAKGETPGVWVGVRDGRHRRPGRRRPGHRGADAGPVRRRAAPAGRAAARGGRRGRVWTRATRSGRPGWGRRSRSTPRRRRRSGSRWPSGSPSSTWQRGLPADAPVALADRARIRTEVAVEFFRAEYGRDPADARELAATIAQALAAADHRGRRVRPDVLPGQECQHPVGGRRPAGRGRDRTGPPGRPSATRWRSSEDTPCSPGRAPTGSARSTSAAWSRPRSPTATPAPATPTCTPTSRSRTRCRPWQRQVAVHRRAGPVQGHGRRVGDLQHRAWSSTCAAPSGCGSRPGPNPDARKRPVREIVGVDPALNQRWSTRRAQHRGPPRRAGRRSSRPPTAGRRRRSSRSSWPSRPPWRPATPSTNRAASPSSARTWRDQAAAGARRARARCRPWSRPSWRPPQRASAPRWTARWVARRPAAIRDTLEASRSHLAELARPRRSAAPGPGRATWTRRDIDRVVDLLVDEVLTAHSVRAGPSRRRASRTRAALRRSDGASVYTVAGSTLFTSTRAPGRRGAARGRAPASADGTRVPAGRGRPGAAGADRQRDRPQRRAGRPGPRDGHLRGAGPARDRPRRRRQDHRHAGPRRAPGPTAAAPSSGSPRPRPPPPCSARADRHHHRHPGQAHLAPGPPTATCPTGPQRIGPATLVVIDEAGMADTLSLDTVVEFVIARGGIGPADRRRPAARRDRRRRRPARHRKPPTAPCT